MTPQTQQFLHDPANGVFGDCHRAAVATLLDLPIDEVPHFCDGDPSAAEFERRCDTFLRPRGLVQIRLPFDGRGGLDPVLATMGRFNPGIPYLLQGRSPRGTNHTIVALDDKIVHDPHPSRAGLDGPCDPDGHYWVAFIVGALAPHPAGFRVESAQPQGVRA